MPAYKKQCHTTMIAWLCLIIPAWIAHGATDVEQVQENVDVAIDTLQETQQKEDSWADEKASLTAELKEEKQQKEMLTKQQQRLGKQVEILQKKIAENRRRAEEVERIRREMRGFLDEIFSRLDEQISSTTLVFLTEERRERLNRLEELLLDDAVSIAEKFRRLVEALQIEADYGRDMEIVRERVQLGQESMVMDVLRIGRLSLFCRTSDGSQIGVFDPAASKWQPLPKSYGRSLQQAIEIASKTRPVEMVSLPLGSINRSGRIGAGQ